MRKILHLNTILYKGLCFVLSILIILSAFMTGSYAWRTASHTENIFSGKKTSTGGGGGGGSGASLTPVVYEPIVSKIITGDSPESPAEFSFKLTAAAKTPMPSGSVNTSKTISITGTGQKGFGEIKYTKAGTYTYNITEIKGIDSRYTYDEHSYTLTVNVKQNGYKLEVKSLTYTRDDESRQYDNALFTNVYTKNPKEPPPPDSDSVIISGEKTWVHGANNDADYPQYIIIFVKIDSNIVVQKIVSASDGWKWIFQLPKYDENKQEIKYTIDEAFVNGYSKTIDGYNIINTYIPPNLTDEPNVPSPPSPNPPGDNGNPTPPGNNGNTPNPKTGDTANMAVWFILLIVCAFCMRFTIKRIKK